jgi:hypothetical protein
LAASPFACCLTESVLCKRVRSVETKDGIMSSAPLG